MYTEAAEAADAVERQAANRAVLDALAERLRTQPPPLVVTCARGSSDHAATFGKYLIETVLGVPVASAAPSVTSIYGAEPRLAGALAIAVSQSGRSPDLIATAAAAREAGAWLASLVNDADSPLATIADSLLPLHAGPERSVAATKSFIAALAGLLALVSAWSDDPALADACAAAPGRLRAAWALDWSGLVDGLRDARGLYVVGRGLGLAVAQEAALKFKETCGLHAEAFSAAELRHGPIALAGPDFPLLVFRQEDGTEDGIDALVAEVIERGGRAFVVGAAPGGAEPLPAVEAAPVLQPLCQIQSFYRAVAMLSVARGYDPDRPAVLSKVTRTL